MDTETIAAILAFSLIALVAAESLIEFQVRRLSRRVDDIEDAAKLDHVQIWEAINSIDKRLDA